MNKKNLIITIIVVILAGFISYKIGQSNASASSSVAGTGAGSYGGFGGTGRTGGRGGPGAGGASVVGTVLSTDDTSMTIQLRGTGSQIVFLSATSTRIMKLVDASRSDLVPGSQVSVMGSANPDGSFSGSAVQIRPVQPLPAGNN